MPIPLNLSRWIAASAIAAIPAVAPAQTLNAGMPAPALKLDKWVKGSPVSSFKPGEVYVVEFWATWCGPCKQSIPLLTKLAKEKAGKVTVIGVSVMEQDTAKVEPYVKEMGDKMDYNIAIDDQTSATAASGYMSKNWLEAAKAPGIPYAFVVGRTGKIEYAGSPFEMEGMKVVDKVIDGTWDLKAYNAEVAARQAQMKAAEEQRKAAFEAWKTPPRRELRQVCRASHG
jgi:thiol-disulfide isomerase/thioredoxin